jgi:hypothetical protein
VVLLPASFLLIMEVPLTATIWRLISTWIMGSPVQPWYSREIRRLVFGGVSGIDGSAMLESIIRRFLGVVFDVGALVFYRTGLCCRSLRTSSFGPRMRRPPQPGCGGGIEIKLRGPSFSS